ncbi:carboxylesterase/lipase family protein [Zwartia sp.]|uniref:carboxylesterase/lipase family protein n=1 Tax=Zwartia sp. TaxID=2978004 RepID=UPI002721C580|nr:carboxylesterase/lipase family protein [Zwartia sp.]MDO9023760.1 carboxylesterase/lipase family protein [Zwartia sp.]
MRKLLTLIVFQTLLLPSVFANVFSESRPVVAITYGKLQGVKEHGMAAFKNIPYAAAPVGDLRWRPPTPPHHWSDTRDASKFGQACVQPAIKGMNEELVPGSEDCLKLNVFTPDPSSKDLPVMVWIHGGGLFVGSATEPYYQPIGLVKEGVVVVTLDYRLGKLGFFAPKELGEEAKRNNEPVGNYGTMDQIAALKWVQQNIQHFGGNPNNVTIFGESAGGRSVTWLMSSPAAQGLFHKAIAESAQQSPIRGQSVRRHWLATAEELDAKYLNIVGAKTLAELRAMPADKLVLTPQDFLEGVFGGPMIDGKILVDDPLSVFAQGKQHKVPFIIGVNSWDQGFLVPQAPPVATFTKLMNQNLEEVTALYKDFKNTCILSAEVMGDAWYRGSTKMLADFASKHAPSYAYYFNYLTPAIRNTHQGTPHTFEIPYVFGSMQFVLKPPSKVQDPVDQCTYIEKAKADARAGMWSSYWWPTADANDKQDQAISLLMSKSWATFAKTGNPNVSGLPAWPSYTLKEDVMREFSHDDRTLMTGLQKKRVDYQIQSLRKLYKLN